MSKAKKFTVTDGKMVLVLEVAEEGSYVVTAPFVQGLITQGETVEEAFEMAYDAAALLQETAAGRMGTVRPKRKPMA